MIHPEELFPLKGFKNTIFLKPLIAKNTVKNVHAGDYSYYSDFDDPTEFLTKNILYNYGISGNSVYIGKFCAFAHGLRIIMPDANHVTKGITTYPFAVFGEKFAESMPLAEYPFNTYKDTCIGNDVWIGYDVTIMPGVHIGDGAIIGAKSVVASDIPSYSVAVGNPAKVIKQRFPKETQQTLLDICWWDWDIKHITQAIPILVKGNVKSLLTFMKTHNISRL